MTPELRKEIRKSRISDSFQKIVKCYRDGKTPEAKTIDNISNELYNELFYDMDNVLIDGIEDKIKEIIKSPKSSPNKKPFEILSLLGLYNGEFYDKDIEDSNDDDECINKYINVSIDGLPKKERILDKPAVYSLIDIFKELKFGRPAASQQFLDRCINRLSSDTMNFSEAVESLYDGKLVTEINWTNDYGKTPYLKLLRTHEPEKNELDTHVIDQPFIAKFEYNGGYMSHPYIPTDIEFIKGEFKIIETVSSEGDKPSPKQNIDYTNDKLPSFKFTPPAPAELKAENKEDIIPYGYMLIKPENREEVFFMIGYKIYYCEDIIITKDEDIIKLSEAGVLNEWFVPVFMCDKEKLVFGFPDGFMNIGVTTDGYLIADTNNSADWRTLKFKLPKGKGNWVLFNQNIHNGNVTLHSLVEKGNEELIQDSFGKTINTNEEPIQDSMGKKIIDNSKLRPYNRIDVLSSLEGKMNMDDLGGDLTKIALTYAHDGITKKDLELSIRIMTDIIRNPQFYLKD